MQGSAFAYLTQNFRRPKYFNTHPWLAAAFAQVLEKEVSNGRNANQIRLLWMGTLGALGDGIFWASLRPMFIVIGLIGLGSSVVPFWVVPTGFFILSILVRLQVQMLSRSGEEGLVYTLQRYKLRERMDDGRRLAYISVAFISGAAWSFLLTLDRSKEVLSVNQLNIVMIASGLTCFAFAITKKNLPIRWVIGTGSVLVALGVWMIQ